MRSLFNFVKQVLAATLGVALFSFFCFIFCFILVYSTVVSKIAMRSEERTEVIQENTILRYKLRGEIVEYRQDTPTGKEIISIAEVDAILEQAAENPHIQGIFIELDDIYGGLDSLDALRQAFEKFKKKAAKPIVIYSSGYNDALLAFASIADKRILHPSGNVLLKGLSFKQLFYKGLLDHFDVEATLTRAGKYKVASMPYVNEKMQHEDKEQWRGILHTKHDFLKEKILTNKKIKKEELDKILHEKPFLTPKEAYDLGFIDIIGYVNAADKCFNEYFNEGQTSGENDTKSSTQEPGNTEGEDEEEDPPHYISYEGYKKSLLAFFVRSNYSFKGSKVGVLPLTGDIVSKATESQTINEEKIIPMLQYYEKQEDVKVIVIIMDSPGGYSIPTANISHEIERIKKKKPVICLVRNGAFSGGLHIAVSCTKVIASSPGTAIGSIGVWTMDFNLKKAAEKHLYITADGVKTHEHADFLSDHFHERTEKEKDLLQKALQYEYERFKAVVQKARNMTDEQIEAAAEGRVFTAQKALELKLIDEIASEQSLQRAIDFGLELAGIDKEEEEIQVVYPMRKISIKSYLALFIKSIIHNKSPLLIHQKGKKMYHLGYDLRQEGQHT